MAQDPYDILQVAHHAEPEVIEAAYRRLARKYHPDTNSSANATAHMQEINWAYDILKDPAKRASYDRGARPQASPKPKPPQAKPKHPPPKPPPPKPKPPPSKPKPKPPPPKPKAEPVKEAPQAWWKPRQMGPTERRNLRLVGAIGLILIAIFAINRDPAPLVRATAEPPTAPLRSTGNVTLDSGSGISVSLFSSEFRVIEQLPDGSVCNQVGQTIWRTGDGSEYVMLEIECPESDAKGWVHLYRTDKYVPPTEPPSTEVPEPIGKVRLRDSEGNEGVGIYIPNSGATVIVPNGTVCELLEEITAQVFSQGELHPELEYSIRCPEYNVIGLIWAENAELTE